MPQDSPVETGRIPIPNSPEEPTPDSPQEGKTKERARQRARRRSLAPLITSRLKRQGSIHPSRIRGLYPRNQSMISLITLRLTSRPN